MNKEKKVIILPFPPLRFASNFFSISTNLPSMTERFAADLSWISAYSMNKSSEKTKPPSCTVLRIAPFLSTNAHTQHAPFSDRLKESETIIRIAWERVTFQSSNPTGELASIRSNTSRVISGRELFLSYQKQEAR